MKALDGSAAYRGQAALSEAELRYQHKSERLLTRRLNRALRLGRGTPHHWELIPLPPVPNAPGPSWRNFWVGACALQVAATQHEGQPIEARVLPIAETLGPRHVQFAVLPEYPAIDIDGQRIYLPEATYNGEQFANIADYGHAVLALAGPQQ